MTQDRRPARQRKRLEQADRSRGCAGDGHEPNSEHGGCEYQAIVAAGVLVWSLMATLCGLARSAWQLFFARMGVGVGEAALSPAAYSMLTDAFPPEKRGRAFSIYNMGISIGSRGGNRGRDCSDPVVVRAAGV